MAPEILSQKPHLGTGDASLNSSVSGPKVDVWSLGMILLEMFLVRLALNCEFFFIPVRDPIKW